MEESEPIGNEEVNSEVNDSILKPKTSTFDKARGKPSVADGTAKKRTYTDEQRKQMAERMRKVNQDRMEKVRLANENALKVKQEELERVANEKIEIQPDVKHSKQQLKKIEKTIQAVKSIRGPKVLTESLNPVNPLNKAEEGFRKPEKKPKTKKQILVELSSSESESSEDEQPQVILVPKAKSKATPKAPKSVSKESICRFV